MRYFVTSDLHSFSAEMRRSLRKAGFNKRNKDHTLIVCGDVFDRGPDAIGVYEYLSSIPKRRRVLIKGNHEELFLKLLDKPAPDDYDFSNHTVDTFCQIARSVDPGFEFDCCEDWFEPLSYSCMYGVGDDGDWLSALKRQWRAVADAVRGHPITRWLKSGEWLDYYEMGRFVFVHSFIPVRERGLAGMGEPGWGPRPMEGWRTEATPRDWSEARWGCPWSQYADGLFDREAEAGKTLVCGHWHVSDFWSNLAGDNSLRTSVYYSEHLIGLDCGCWKMRLTGEYYHPTNVMVIDGGECYQNGEPLKPAKPEIGEVIPDE